MFSAAKDAMASRAAQSFINGRIGRYGQLQELKIDSSNRRMQATATLHGEAAPVTLHIDRYEITESGNKRFLRVQQCRAPRVWLQNALDDFVVGREIELPPWAAAAL